MFAGPFNAQTIWIWSLGTPTPKRRPLSEFLAFFRNLASLMAKPWITCLMRRGECVSVSNSAACQSGFCHTYWACTGSVHIVAAAAAAAAPPSRVRRENSLMDFSPLAAAAQRGRAISGWAKSYARQLGIVHPVASPQAAAFGLPGNMICFVYQRRPPMKARGMYSAIAFAILILVSPLFAQTGGKETKIMIRA